MEPHPENHSKPEELRRGSFSPQRSNSSVYRKLGKGIWRRTPEVQIETRNPPILQRTQTRQDKFGGTTYHVAETKPERLPTLKKGSNRAVDTPEKAALRQREAARLEKKKRDAFRKKEWSFNLRLITELQEQGLSVANQPKWAQDLHNSVRIIQRAWRAAILRKRWKKVEEAIKQTDTPLLDEALWGGWKIAHDLWKRSEDDADNALAYDASSTRSSWWDSSDIISEDGLGSAASDSGSNTDPQEEAGSDDGKQAKRRRRGGRRKRTKKNETRGQQNPPRVDRQPVSKEWSHEHRDVARRGGGDLGLPTFEAPVYSNKGRALAAAGVDRRRHRWKAAKGAAQGANRLRRGAGTEVELATGDRAVAEGADDALQSLLQTAGGYVIDREEEEEEDEAVREPERGEGLAETAGGRSTRAMQRNRMAARSVRRTKKAIERSMSELRQEALDAKAAARHLLLAKWRLEYMHQVVRGHIKQDASGGDDLGVKVNRALKEARLDDVSALAKALEQGPVSEENIATFLEGRQRLEQIQDALATVSELVDEAYEGLKAGSAYRGRRQALPQLDNLAGLRRGHLLTPQPEVQREKADSARRGTHELPSIRSPASETLPGSQHVASSRGESISSQGSLSSSCRQLEQDNSNLSLSGMCFLPRVKHGLAERQRPKIRYYHRVSDYGSQTHVPREPSSPIQHRLRRMFDDSAKNIHRIDDLPPLVGHRIGQTTRLEQDVKFAKTLQNYIRHRKTEIHTNTSSLLFKTYMHRHQ